MSDDGLRSRIIAKWSRANLQAMLALRRRDVRAFAKWSRQARWLNARHLQATYHRIGIRYPMHGMIQHAALKAKP